MNTLIKPYPPLKKLNKKTKKVLPASFGKKIIGHFQVFSIFWPVFQGPFIIFQGSSIRSYPKVKNHPKSCVQMVHDMLLS